MKFMHLFKKELKEMLTVTTLLTMVCTVVIMVMAGSAMSGAVEEAQEESGEITICNLDDTPFTNEVLKFLENPVYNEANNISSAMIARYMLSNAYVFEADLLISNPNIIKKYHYTSDFLAIKKDRTDDWCFTVKNGIIVEEKVGGLDCWQMVGISYWNETDGHKLSHDIADVYQSPGGKERYWEQVPLVYRKNNYAVEIMECHDEDIIEIDTFRELKAIDKTYDV